MPLPPRGRSPGPPPVPNQDAEALIRRPPGITAPPPTPIQPTFPFTFQPPDFVDTSGVICPLLVSPQELPYPPDQPSMVRPRNWTERLREKRYKGSKIGRRRRRRPEARRRRARTTLPSIAGLLLGYNYHLPPPTQWNFSVFLMFSISMCFVDYRDWVTLPLCPTPDRLCDKVIQRYRFREASRNLHRFILSPALRFFHLDSLLQSYGFKALIDLQYVLELGIGETYFEFPVGHSSGFPAIGVIDTEQLWRRQCQMQSGTWNYAEERFLGIPNGHVAHRLAQLMPDDKYEDPYIAGMMIAMAQRQCAKAEELYTSFIDSMVKDYGLPRSRMPEWMSEFTPTKHNAFQASENPTAYENKVIFPIYLFLIAPEDHGMWLYKADIPYSYLTDIGNAAEVDNVPLVDIKYEAVCLSSGYGARNQLESLMFNRLKA